LLSRLDERTERSGRQVVQEAAGRFVVRIDQHGLTAHCNRRVEYGGRWGRPRRPSIGINDRHRRDARHQHRESVL